MTFEQLATGQIVVWPGSIVVHDSPVEHVTLWTDETGEPQHAAYVCACDGECPICSISARE